MEWLDESGATIAAFDFDGYIRWRRAYRKGETQSYERGGKTVTGKRCARHHLPVGDLALNKGNNTLRVFFKWLVARKHLARQEMPDVPMLSTSKTIITPVRVGKSRRRTPDEIAAAEEMADALNVGNWFPVEEFARLRAQAWNNVKAADLWHRVSLRQYRPAAGRMAGPDVERSAAPPRWEQWV